ncbi:hypothetical protein VP1G_05845 [Cytospora mali]|uniref:Malate dehydrogenase n=1 Tax=Cytospora mali TaxID=578113 RepID=A0A194V3M5_CYTMA|nr:hypothetical protein VP1G_05845 [Valsa mali var. pyri (nom. inval.)]
MHFSKSVILAACLTTAAVAAPHRKRSCPTPTLPSTGSTDLPSPPSNLTLKYIAIGHGIQNYTCASTDATAVNIGALAVLYDITPLYPGTSTTGLSSYEFNDLSSTVLWDQDIPLNLVDPTAGKTTSYTTSFPETDYQAVASDPFPTPAADLSIPSQGIYAKYLGHHYFDSKSSPTFDLAAVGLRLSGTKTGDVKAPADADKGILDTGAVDWLELGDNGRGLSVGLSVGYRVETAGGTAQACSVSGTNPTGQVLSVPYTAQYWFYG